MVLSITDTGDALYWEHRLSRSSPITSRPTLIEGYTFPREVFASIWGNLLPPTDAQSRRQMYENPRVSYSGGVVFLGKEIQHMLEMFVNTIKCYLKCFENALLGIFYRMLIQTRQGS